MKVAELFQYWCDKAERHLGGGTNHLPNALNYAYWAIAISHGQPAADRRKALQLLSDAITAAQKIIREGMTQRDV